MPKEQTDSMSEPVKLSDLPWEGHDKHEFIGDKTLCYETEGGARVPMAVFMLGRLKLCKT